MPELRGIMSRANQLASGWLSPTGLFSEEAARRFTEFGRNALTDGKPHLFVAHPGDRLPKTMKHGVFSDKCL